MKQMKDFETFAAETEQEKEHFQTQIEDANQALEQKTQIFQQAKQFSHFISGNTNTERNYLLIQKGIAIESACRDTELMSPAEFYILAKELFSTDQIRQKIQEIIAERK